MGGGYDIQESVLYWKFAYIKEWCQLKCNIPAICSWVYYGDRNIKCLQVLAWWVIDLILRGKITNLNNFKTNVLSDAIEESWIDFEDTIDGNGSLVIPNSYHIKIGINGRTESTNNSLQVKIVVVCPYLMSS